MRFLGNISDDENAIAKGLLGDISDKTKPFEIKISEIRLFPDKYPRYLFAIIEKTNSLQHLHSLLNAAFDQLKIGQSEKRGFQPHLTLVRFKNSWSGKVSPKISFQSGWIAEEIHLMQSLLKPTGSEYKLLESYQFKK